MKQFRKTIRNDTIFRSYARIFFTKATSDLIIGSFFIIFIYRATGSVIATAFCLLLYTLGLFIGTLIAVLLSKRINFLGVIQASFFLLGIVFIAVATSIKLDPSFIPFLLFINGIPVGLYFLGQHQFQTALIHDDKERHSLLFSVFGISRILATILPVVSGFFIFYGGYSIVFAAVGVIYILASILPFKVSLKKVDTFSFSEFQALFKNKYLPAYSLLTFVSASINELRNLSFLLIPFFFLRESEFNLGILISVIALSSGIITWLFKDAKRDVTAKYSVIGGIFISIINFLFGFFWNPLSLIIRSLLLPIGEIFYIPQSDADEYTAIHAVIGKSKQLSIELLLVREATFLAARIWATILFLAAFQASGQNYILLAQIVMIILAIWPLVTFLLRSRLIHHIEKAESKTI
jgi:hypothetical protein